MYPSCLGEQLAEACDQGDWEKAKALIEQGADIHFEEDRPFRAACMLGSVPMAVYLFDKGADPHANGDHALQLAYYHDRLEVIEFLVSLKSRTYWLTHSNSDVREIYEEYLSYKKFKRMETGSARLMSGTKVRVLDGSGFSGRIAYPDQYQHLESNSIYNVWVVGKCKDDKYDTFLTIEAVSPNLIALEELMGDVPQ